MPGEKETFPLKVQQELPVVRPPPIQFLGLQTGENGAPSLLLELGNPNHFDVRLNRLNHGLELNGQPLVARQTIKALLLPRGGSSQIAVPFELNIAALGFGVFQLLQGGGEGAGWRLHGDVDLQTTQPLIGNLKMPFDESGKL